MKNFKYITLVIIVMITGFSINGHAQTVYNNVPQTVSKACLGKYPDAKLRGWDVEKGMYVAKISQDHHKYFAVFNSNGNWIKTTSDIRWPWGLPGQIKQAFKSSGFYSWHMYFAKKIETPSGTFYQLLIDNANTNEIAMVDGKLATDRLLEFTANGVLTLNNDITESPAP